MTTCNMNARKLIEAISPRDYYHLGRLAAESGIRSSASVGYSSQESKWRELIQRSHLSEEDFVTAMIEIERQPFAGVEGLWEVTKDERLWPMTDYYSAGETDQYCVSYFYGSNERVKAWDRNVQRNFEMMASSLAQVLGGRAHGQIVRFQPGNGDYWEADEAIDGLIKNGWPIEDRRNQGTVVVGGNIRSEVGRLLDQ